MSRVINPNSAGKERNQLMKAVAIALRELLANQEPNDEARDFVAFIAAALGTISDGIEPSLEAWEKRGYWLKADRFRLEWEWAGRMSRDLEKALRADDWGAIALECVKLGEKVAKVKVAKNPRIGTPWKGAWRKLAAAK